MFGMISLDNNKDISVAVTLFRFKKAWR